MDPSWHPLVCRFTDYSAYLVSYLYFGQVFSLLLTHECVFFFLPPPYSCGFIDSITTLTMLKRKKKRIIFNLVGKDF